MNKIKLLNGTTYNVCKERYSSDYVGFTVITDDVATLLTDIKDNSVTSKIEWLDSEDKSLGEWNDFTDLKTFTMEQNVVTGVEFDEEGRSKGDTYADFGYFIMLNKVSPEYVTKEEYDDLLNAMIELASIVGGDE